MTDHITSHYDTDAKSFVFSYDNSPRLIFDNFELNFRLSRISLKSKQIIPLANKDYQHKSNYPLVLKGMGSSKVLRLSQPSASLSIETAKDAALISYHNDFDEPTFSPDQPARIVLSEIPGIKRGVFYHNRSDEFQNFDCEGLWWSQAAFFNECKSELFHDWGLLSCWQYNDGLVGGLLPVTTNQAIGKLRFDGPEGLSTIACTGVTGQLTKTLPLALIAFSNSIENLIDHLLTSLHQIYPNFNLEKNKALPEPFDKLGWCSWNAFGPNVNQNDIRKTIDSAKVNNLPLGYILIDDGWLDIDSDTNEPILAEGITDCKLKSLEADSEKFPDGIKSLVQYAKKSGINHVALWHTSNGYWNGLSQNNPLVESHPQWFKKTGSNIHVPAENSPLYDLTYSKIKEWDVSFVKIDNQGFHRRVLPYETNLANYMSNIQTKLQNALNANDLKAIYCMATHPEVIFNSKTRQLLRISNDFIPNDVYGARKHIVNNFYNDFWLNKIFWSDFDMFQSNDLFAETFARMFAISNSPVYITDKPDQINLQLLKKMILPAGQIPRYKESAKVLPSRFFDDPYQKNNILAVQAKHHDITTLGLFNTIETGQATTGNITLNELCLNGSTFLAYSDSRCETTVLTAQNASILYSLKNLKSDLVHIVPIQNGFAFIGNIDYFAAPALIEKITTNRVSAEIKLIEAGTVLGYSKTEPESVICDSQSFKKVKSNPKAGEFSWHNGILKINSVSKEIKINLQ